MFNRHEAGRITFQELFDYHVICRGWQSHTAIYVVLFLNWDKTHKTQFGRTLQNTNKT